MTSYTVKCNLCNIVIDEMLSYIQNKISVIDEETLVRICTTAFTSEEINRSKSLLFESVPTERRKIQRKRDGKEQRDLMDIICVLKTTEPDLVPIFVARQLEKLPPVTFDHLDCTKLLKDLVRLQDEVNNIKDTYATAKEVENLQAEIQLLRNYSPPKLPLCSINVKRGAWCLDSGPMGLSQCVEKENEQDPEYKSAVFSSFSSSSKKEKSTSNADDKNIVTTQTNQSQTNCVSETPNTCVKEKDASMCQKHTEPAAPATARVSDDGVVNVNVNNQNNWQTVEPRKKKKLSYRYLGQRGAAECESSKFKAAERKIAMFITNIHKDTSETDISEYIMLRTQECVTLEKITMKTGRNHNAYKFFVSECKLSLFLDVNLWPKGIIFRRFMHYRRKQKTGLAPVTGTTPTRNG